MRIRTLAAQAQADSWSTTDITLGFGMPFAVFLVGLLVFMGGRREREALRADAQHGGFGGPPGTTDVGSAEGFGVEETRSMIHAASRKVLIGLFIMLSGLLALLVVIFTGILR
ncbi:MAG: hypothetical protein WA892_13920 [Ornithinimicrobium sp.]